MLTKSSGKLNLKSLFSKTLKVIFLNVSAELGQNKKKMHFATIY